MLTVYYEFLPTGYFPALAYCILNLLSVENAGEA